jgi:YVTN family beta-propeller protein
MTYDRAPRGPSRAQAHRRTGRRFPARSIAAGTVITIVAIVALGSLIFGKSPSPASSPDLGAGVAARSAAPSGSLQAVAPATPASLAPTTPGPAASPGPAQDPLASTSNIYAHAGAGMFSPSVASFPPRVYVPDEASGTVIVIDPRTFKILYRYSVGSSPEHVTPDWDLQRLYVEAALSNRLTVIDPRTGRAVGHHTVPGPYNLYFTPDGRLAIVVRDGSLAYGGQQQLYFYDRRTWRLIKSVRVPWAGADHLDFSADGSYFLISTEYSGWVAKVDVAKMAVVNALFVGGRPIDVRLAPDGKLFYVANQGSNGVSIIDPIAMRLVGFVKTGLGAHGLSISRDARSLYVTNREAGSLSVIDFATRRVVATWHIGGTPDMIAVSPDGNQLWISNRYSGTVSVIDAHTGRVITVIRVGGHPHGLAYFPEPGRFSLGHNGIYR